jgi:hypothetical protein
VAEEPDTQLARVAFVRAYDAEGLVPTNPQLPQEWACLISSRFGPIESPESEVDFAHLGESGEYLLNGVPVSFSLSALFVRPSTQL